MWDLATDRELPQFQGPRYTPIRAFAFSLDGRSLAIDSADEAPRLWEIATGQQRRRFERKLDGNDASRREAKMPRPLSYRDRLRRTGVLGALAVSAGNRLLAHSRPDG